MNSAHKKASGRATVVAGAFAGGCARLAVAPLDVVKIRAQVDGDGRRWKADLRWLFRSIREQEGFRGFFRGNTPAMGLYVSYAACQFWCYEAAQQLVGGWSFVGRVPRDFGCGAVAAGAATVLTFPLDYMRTILAVENSKRLPTMRSVLERTLEHRGLRGLYDGCGASLMQIVPFMGLNFMFYEQVRRAIAAWRPPATAVPPEERRSSASVSAVAGLVAGVAAKLSVYPLDTLKRLLGVQMLLATTREGEMGSGCDEQQRRFIEIPRRDSTAGEGRSTSTSPRWSMLRTRTGLVGHALADVVERYGVLFLYRGASVAAAKVGVSSSLHFACFEAAMRWQAAWADE